ncbi:hypothetical protein B0H10DRAFT_1795290, partial [Mycena sp. CBHHK59/15]
ILHNWLLNPTGKINAFVEVYLVQEHLNLWIKVSCRVPSYGLKLVLMEFAENLQSRRRCTFVGLASPCIIMCRCSAPPRHFYE